MEALASVVVEKYPFTVMGKDAVTGQWRFVCAVENRVKAELVAQAVFDQMHMETRVEATA